MDWRKIKLGTIATVLSAVGGFVYWAWTGKDVPLAAEQPMVALIPLDAVVPLKLELSTAKSTTDVIYLNGNKLPIDGYGCMVVTLADWQAKPEILGDHVMQSDDFPVLAFFNPSAFDITGAFTVVRRAANGELLSEIQERPPELVRVIWPHRDGGYNVVSGKGTKEWVPLDGWQRRYQGVTQEAVTTAPAAEPAALQPLPSLQDLKRMVLDEAKHLHALDD